MVPHRAQDCWRLQVMPCCHSREGGTVTARGNFRAHNTQLRSRCSLFLRRRKAHVREVKPRETFMQWQLPALSPGQKQATTQSIISRKLAITLNLKPSFSSSLKEISHAGITTCFYFFSLSSVTRSIDLYFDV